jgi:hypothetical protein
VYYAPSDKRRRRRVLIPASSKLQEIVMAECAAALTSFVAAALAAVTASEASAHDGERRTAMGSRHDAFAFCRSESPNVDRITACMVNNLKKPSLRKRA